jgi:hypothetical protein
MWQEHLAAGQLSRWRELHRNVNVHRRFAVTATDGTELLGPVLLDMDCEEEIMGTEHTLVGRRSDLAAAQRLTCLVVEKLGAGIAQDDLRVFFSGRKGFHVELRPSALGIVGTRQQQMDLAGKWEAAFLDNLEFPESCCIDRVFRAPRRLRGSYEIKTYHPAIRLHDSLNCWKDARVD